MAPVPNSDAYVWKAERGTVPVVAPSAKFSLMVLLTVPSRNNAPTRRLATCSAIALTAL